MLNHQDKAHFNELSVISPSSYGLCVQHIFLSFVVYILTFVGEPGEPPPHHWHWSCIRRALTFRGIG